MMSLDEMYKTFPNNQACLTYIFRHNYGNAICPRCGRTNSFHFAKLTKAFMCTCGMYSIYPRKGTIFEKSGTDLTKWFLAIYLMAHEQDGFSTMALKNKTGTDFHTASTMRKKIMNLILKHIENYLEWGHILRLKIKAMKKHRSIPKGKEKLYVAEYLYRERDRSPDPFLTLLHLAIKPQTPLSPPLS